MSSCLLKYRFHIREGQQDKDTLWKRKLITRMIQYTEVYEDLIVKKKHPLHHGNAPAAYT